jgi:hypothetical protein
MCALADDSKSATAVHVSAPKRSKFWQRCAMMCAISCRAHPAIPGCWHHAVARAALRIVLVLDDARVASNAAALARSALRPRQARRRAAARRGGGVFRSLDDDGRDARVECEREVLRAAALCKRPGVQGSWARLAQDSKSAADA